MIPKVVDDIDDLVAGHGPVFLTTSAYNNGEIYCVTGTVGMFVLWKESRGKFYFVDREPSKMTLSGSLLSASVSDVRKAAQEFMTHAINNQ